MTRTFSGIIFLVLIAAPLALSAQGDPDVIVGDLYDLDSYGGESGIYAYAVGTESCNIGTALLDWQQNTPFHPVIGQEMYRLKDGVMEQIGISWLKHGFCALSLDLCSPCSATNCDTLGIGCSDPYSAGLNGSQGNLGPRSQVNPHTGVFPYPYSAPPFNGTVARRLQVHEEDLDGALNVGALYFVTGHYVTQDDAQGGNGNNNTSYRQVDVDEEISNYALSFTPGQVTQQQSPGIQAWQDHQPSVTLNDLQIPGDGLIIVGHDVIDNGNGTWRYEYAVYNMNADRAIRSFSVQIPGSLSVTDIGFHDVDHHSGEPYSGTDWTGVYNPGVGVSWTTASYSQNTNANAIRWSTMYNFRFTADAPPAASTATLGIFKPGTPTTMSTPVDAPLGSTVPPLTNLTCTPGVGEVELAWTNGSTYDTIEVFRDNNLLASIPGASTSYTDPNGTPGFYGYDVVGFEAGDPTLPASCDVNITLRIVEIEDLTAFAGQAALDVPILATNSAPLEGFDLSVAVPSDRLSVVEASFAGTATEANGAEFAQTDFGTDWVTFQVVMDAVGPFAGQTIPDGNDTEIAHVVFSVSQTVSDGETRTLAFTDGIAPSGLVNAVLIDGVVQTPILVDGTVTFQSQPTFVRGNCDSLGNVNIADAVYMLAYMFAGGAIPSCQSACDFNDDGAMQITDAVLLLGYLFSGGTSPAAPHPDAGADPTPDGLPCS